MVDSTTGGVRKVNQELYLDKQRFTLEEYREELNQPVDYPDPNDCNDKRYYKKYAHNMPPLEAYFLIPDGHDAANTPDDTQARLVFWGWNNLNDFEKEGIQQLIDFLKVKGIPIPPDYYERDLLKFCEAEYFKTKKVAEKIAAHFEWLYSLPPEPVLIPKTMKLIQSGSFYIGGRDKWLRPTFIMDAAVISQLAKNDPGTMSPQNFVEAFLFMFEYCKKVILLPGHVEQWVTIADFGNIAMNKLPKDEIMAFGKLCQANIMFFLHKSFYVHVGWGQRLAYKAAKIFIDPRVQAKISLNGEKNPVELLELYHPSQLEQRFGGTAETPTNFWPPQMSQEFYPNGDKSHLKFIPHEQYESVLTENPELRVHPEFLTSSSQNSRDFKVSEGGARQSVREVQKSKEVEEQQFDSKDGYGRLGTEVDNGDGTYGNSFRTGSVYFDANEGVDVKEQLEKMGLLTEEEQDSMPLGTRNSEMKTPKDIKVSDRDCFGNISNLKIYNDNSPSSLQTSFNPHTETNDMASATDTLLRAKQNRSDSIDLPELPKKQQEARQACCAACIIF